MRQEFVFCMFNFWGLAKVYTAFSAGKDADSIYIDTFNFKATFADSHVHLKRISQLEIIIKRL